jgi:3-oxoadipate enol-lactonase
VRSLALIATFADAPYDLLVERADHAERDGMEAQVSESIIRWFLPETIAANPWFVRYARTLLRRALVSDWAAAWRAMASLKTLDRLPGLDMPVHVIAGRQDRSTHPEDMKPIADAIPGATYAVIDPGTHMMPLEQPEALAAFRERVDGLSVQLHTTQHD